MVATNSSTSIIAGNFTQTSSGEIVVLVSSNNTKSSPLNVAGCVSVNGQIVVTLQTRPQPGTTSLQVISYNCTQTANTSSVQITVKPNYNGSDCDTINPATISNPGELGVSLTSTLGNKCGGAKTGLIIGLAVGVPVGVFLVVAVLVLFTRKRRKQRLDQMKNEDQLKGRPPASLSNQVVSVQDMNEMNNFRESVQLTHQMK